MTNNIKLKTIVIILASPLNEDILKRIGFHSFKNKMNLIIFDCLPWIRKKVIPNNFQYLSLDVITIKDYIDFKKNLTKLKCDFLIDFIGFHKQTKYIQKCCKTNKILYI